MRTDTATLGVLLARARVRITYVVVALVAVAVVVYVAEGVSAHLSAIEAWVSGLGPAGVILFVLLYVVLASAFFPESLLAIAAGTLFGLGAAMIAIVAGGLCAAVVQYLISRELFGAVVDRRLASKPKLAAIRDAVLGDQLRMQVLLRLTPLGPTLMNYILGASGVRFRVYLLASPAMLPIMMMEAYLRVRGKASRSRRRQGLVARRPARRGALRRSGRHRRGRDARVPACPEDRDHVNPVSRMSWWTASDAATPSTGLPADTMPSLAPGTAARDHPMRDVRWCSPCRAPRPWTLRIGPIPSTRRQGTIAMSFPSLVTPGADQAAHAARSRSTRGTRDGRRPRADERKSATLHDVVAPGRGGSVALNATTCTLPGIVRVDIPGQVDERGIVREAGGAGRIHPRERVDAATV